MQRQPLFYKRVVPLNRQQHKDLFVEAVPGFGFARATNCVYVAAVEFTPAAREYPIVFAPGEDGNVLPVALLGIRNNQNLFVAQDGAWKAKYIPAYVRRYPFILATDDSGGRFTVCIDESYPGFNTAREGERLIADDGEDGPLLKRSVEFLKDYQQHVVRTGAFCKTIRALDLLEPVQANIAMKSGDRFALTGFLCVSKARLKALGDADLAMLVRQDYLELIYLHLQSLTNMDGLLGLLSA